MMRSPIPKVIREQLCTDPFMKNCPFLGEESWSWCEGRIEWHHAFTYAGKRQNELWSIIPLCEYHHEIVAKIKEEVDEVLIERIHHFNAESSFREKYPKSDLLRPKIV